MTVMCSYMQLERLAPQSWVTKAHLRPSISRIQTFLKLPEALAAQRVVVPAAESQVPQVRDLGPVPLARFCRLLL